MNSTLASVWGRFELIGDLFDNPPQNIVAVRNRLYVWRRAGCFGMLPKDPQRMRDWDRWTTLCFRSLFIYTSIILGPMLVYRACHYFVIEHRDLWSINFGWTLATMVAANLLGMGMLWFAICGLPHLIVDLIHQLLLLAAFYVYLCFAVPISIFVGSAEAVVWLYRRTTPEFPRLWDLLGLLFTQRVRDQIWDPLVGEDLVQLIDARRRFRTRLARAWIWTCFVLRTFVRFGQCLWAIGFDRVIGIVMWWFRGGGR